MVTRLLVFLLLGALSTNAQLQPVPSVPLPSDPRKSHRQDEAGSPAPIPVDCSVVTCPANSICEMVFEPCSSDHCPEPVAKCVPLVLLPPPVPEESVTTNPNRNVHPPAPPPSDCSSVQCATGTSCKMITESCHFGKCSSPLPFCVPKVLDRQHVASTTSATPSVPTTLFTTSTRTTAGNVRHISVATKGLVPPSSSAGRSRPVVPHSKHNEVNRSATRPPSATTHQPTASTTKRQPKTHQQNRKHKPYPEHPLRNQHQNRQHHSSTISPASRHHGVSTTKRPAHSTEQPKTSTITRYTHKVKSSDLTCYGKLCPSGSKCRILDNRPMCIPSDLCAGVKCREGTVCHVVFVNSGPKAKCLSKPPPQMRCPRNESWRNCPSLCEPTCEDKDPKCARGCGTPRCQCDPGFVRSHFGFCELAAQC